MTITINIAKEFSPYPGPREQRIGKNSGEEFRKKFLEELFKEESDEPIEIILDGTKGYTVSFLDEAFAGLIHRCSFDPDIVKKRLKFISETEDTEIYKLITERFIDEALKVFKNSRKKASSEVFDEDYIIPKNLMRTKKCL